ncbi:MAG TPA: hypothetical protein VGQ88_02945 [Burkholderiales bacterium]|nr:hypothetical protein [Burkholderiales bacterium]
MIARFVVACILISASAAPAADLALGVLDITLGASYARLERDLDFRDMNMSFAQIKGGKPDLGKRGYGCMKRDDAFADVACVSHDEKLDGTGTREIRLHFLHGRLQQLSVTAELQHYDAVIGYLRARFGAPRQDASPSPDAAPSLKWPGEAGQIIAYRGKDLVFVSFELATYAEAVKRKRDGAGLECN